MTITHNTQYLSFYQFFQNDLSVSVNIADVIHARPLTGSWYLTTGGGSSHGSGPARIWSWHWNNWFLEDLLSPSDLFLLLKPIMEGFDKYWKLLLLLFEWNILELTSDSEDPRDRRRYCRSVCWSRRTQAHCGHCICTDGNLSVILKYVFFLLFFYF